MLRLDRIDDYIVSRGMNKRKFAQDVGICYSTLIAWHHRGTDNASVDIVGQIADYMGVTIDYLMGRDQNIQESQKGRMRLSDSEKKLIRDYRNADQHTRDYIQLSLELSEIKNKK